MEYNKSKSKKTEEYQFWPERTTLKKLADQLKKLKESEPLYSNQEEIN